MTTFTDDKGRTWRYGHRHNDGDPAYLPAPFDHRLDDIGRSQTYDVMAILVGSGDLYGRYYGRSLNTNRMVRIFRVD